MPEQFNKVPPFEIRKGFNEMSKEEQAEFILGGEKRLLPKEPESETKCTCKIVEGLHHYTCPLWDGSEYQLYEQQRKEMGERSWIKFFLELSQKFGSDSFKNNEELLMWMEENYNAPAKKSN